MTSNECPAQGPAHRKCSVSPHCCHFNIYSSSEETGQGGHTGATFESRSEMAQIPGRSEERVGILRQADGRGSALASGI